MLVLLIIFMILSPLLIQGVDVDLPQTDTTKMSIESEPMVVSINDEGRYFLNFKYVWKKMLNVDEEN